jgi:hydroxyacylglutathione hydrolase
MHAASEQGEAMSIEEKHFGPVWFIPGENKGKYPFCHSLYIEGPGILIDPASDRKRLQSLRDDPGVNEVWLSHWHEDHFMHLDLFDDLPLRTSREDAAPLENLDVFLDAYGGDEALRNEWAPLMESLFHFRPRTPSGFLAGGQVLSFDTVTVEVLHTPGHTPGNLSFLFREPEILFLGDYDLTSFGPWYGDVNSSIEDTIASTRRLQQIPAKTWLTCHETGVFDAAPAALWDDYLAVIDRREAKLLALLQEPQSMENIVDACIVYGRPREPKVFFQFGEKAIMQKHVERLLEKGRIVEEGGRLRVA